MTTSAGAPIAVNRRSLTAGAKGPLLPQDYLLVEKLRRQTCERNSNIAAIFDDAPDFIVERRIAIFGHVHPDYGAGVRQAWEKAKKTKPNPAISAPEDERTPALTK